MILSAQKRFWSKVRRTKGCWKWSGWHSHDGYAMFDYRGGGKRRKERAHRIAYELVASKIPEGMELHHRCGNKSCVRPTHLQPMNHRENTLLGNSVVALNARKTHCPQGHAYSKANTLWVYKPSRLCRTCSAMRQRHRYLRRKEQGR